MTKKLKTSAEHDYACLVCWETYSESLPEENWIQCQGCNQWSHSKCDSHSGQNYICINCKMEIED